MVFSISSKQSLTELKPILELINEEKGNLADIPLVLVGNKNDEEAGPREVPYKTGETLQVRKGLEGMRNQDCFFRTCGSVHILRHLPRITTTLRLSSRRSSSWSRRGSCSSRWGRRRRRGRRGDAE
jgi:GTPase SAR1 family protein